MRSVLMSAILLLAAIPTKAADLKDFAGTWAMRVGERNLFVLTLTPEGGTMRGTFQRPVKASGTNGTFANIEGARTDSVVRSQFKDGLLHLTTQNSTDPKDEDSYAMTVNGDRAQLMFDNLPPGGTFIEPYSLERAPATARIATDWEPNRLYVPGADSDVPSAEMKAILAEDQRVRTSEKIDWNVVNKSDEVRREQTRKLLAEGALHTGKDYEEAAFVFQHGDSTQDYLLAHTLAMVAVSKGDPTAIWIAAATLDRYLQKIGQKQILGTQYSSDAKKQWTQEPYDRELVSDALRRQLAVPTQTLQAEQLKAYQSEK